MEAHPCKAPVRAENVQPLCQYKPTVNARVTNVELNVTVSRGSIPFYIVVESPNGYQAERYISTSGKVEFDEFNDFYPKGTWKVYIYNRGSAFTDVSTATARITVNYGYDSYS